MSRRNPKPPGHWTLPLRPGGTLPMDSAEGTPLDRPKSGRRPTRRAGPKRTRDPIQQWLEAKLPYILGEVPTANGKGRLSMADWTGEKLGEGSFGIVYRLRDGRVLKLGFDYSEAWFVHNLNTFFPDDTDVALEALPRIDYFRDISHFEGWEQFLAGAVFSGENRDATAFVLVREDVRGLENLQLGAERVLYELFTQAAKKVRTSVESRESPDPTVLPDLREGFYVLDNFEINGRPKDLRYEETPESWGWVEAAQGLIHPTVAMLRELNNRWEIFLPDARGANFGVTEDGKVVLRDLGWVYAPQYSEWDVTEELPIEDADY